MRRTLIAISLSWILGSASLAQEPYSTALQLYKAGQYANAAPYFAAAWQRNPHNISAGYYAGYCYYQGGNRAQAVAVLKQVAVASPAGKETAMAGALLRSIDPSAATSAASAQTSGRGQGLTMQDVLSTLKKQGFSTQTESADSLISQLIKVSPPTGKLKAVTPDFVAHVRAMLTGVPAPVLRLLRDNGGHVCIMPSIIEKDYRTQNTTPRGWEGGSSWKDSPAMSTGADVNIAEYRLNDRTGDYVTTTDELGVVRHELGHSIDYCLGYITQQEEFKHAYFLDAAKVPQDARGTISYYLQTSSAGPSETFAELCCYRFGGETDAGRKEACNLVHRYFPLSNAVLEKYLPQ